MKKIILMIILCFVTLSFTISCNKIKGIQKPSVQVKDIKLQKITLKNFTLGMVLDVYNPYPIGGKLNYIKWGVYINSNQLFKTETPPGKNFEIKANGHAFNPFDVKFKYKDIYRIIKDVKNSDFFNYTVKGNIGFNLGRFGNYDLAFNHTDKFPVIKIKLKVSNFKVGNPKVKLALANPPDNFPGISLRNLRKKVNQSVNPQFTVDVNYDLTFINQSKAPISFSDLVYEFNIDGNNIAKGNSGKPISYNGKTAIFRFKNTLNLTGVLKSLFAKKRAGYTLKGSFNLNLPIFGRRNIPFSVKGNLNW